MCNVNRRKTRTKHTHTHESFRYEGMQNIEPWVSVEWWRGVAKMITFIVYVFVSGCAERWKEANLITYWSKRRFRRSTSWASEMPLESHVSHWTICTRHMYLRFAVRHSPLAFRTVKNPRGRRAACERKLFRLSFSPFGWHSNRNAIIIKTC